MDNLLNGAENEDILERREIFILTHISIEVGEGGADGEVGIITSIYLHISINN